MRGPKVANTSRKESKPYLFYKIKYSLFAPIAKDIFCEKGASISQHYWRIVWQQRFDCVMPGTHQPRVYMCFPILEGGIHVFPKAAYVSIKTQTAICRN